MEVGRTSHIGSSGKTDRKNGQAAQRSRALTIPGEFSRTPGPRTRTGSRPHRCTCAFLAHLTLQYDEITVRRRERAERLEMAIESYSAGERGQAAWPLYSDLNLKV